MERHGLARLCRGSASPPEGLVWWSAERRVEGGGGEREVGWWTCMRLKGQLPT